MTASKMKKYPILASDTKSSSLLPTNHKESTSSSTSSSSLSSSSSSNNHCGKKSSSSFSSCNERISNNYRSSANELTMIDGSADKQVESLYDSTHNNLESLESKLNLTCRHGMKHHIIEANTMLPHSFPSNEQLKTIVNKNIQLVPHWRWKRWYETWLCFRQIGQIKSKRTHSTIASTMVMKGYSSLSSWLSHFTTLLVVLSVMPFGVQSGPHERRLINDLLDRYQNLERPVYNETEPLNLKFGLTLQQIIDVDEKKSTYYDQLLVELGMGRCKFEME